MRITFLSLYSNFPSGGVRTIYEYANRLSAMGHEINVVHGKVDPEHLPSRVPPWFPLDERVKLIFADESNSDNLPDSDAVFFYDKTLPPEKGHPFTLIQGYGVFDKSLDDGLFKSPTTKICVSRWLLEKGLELGVPPEELVHIPNGIDHEVYKVLVPIELRPRRIAMHYVHDWNLPFKGGENGMRALEIVRKFHQNVEIVLFGIHPRPAGLDGRYLYEHNPPQDRLVREIYNGSSIFACASWHEGFGFPGAEAMACGCALATTDTGGSREYAEHGVTSLVSEPRKPELLAENIIRLLDDDALRIRLARAGHERVRQFTWERSAARMERLIQYELASGRRLSGAI